MTPKIRQFLKDKHQIKDQDVYTTIEVSDFLGLTLHRNNGITEIARYIVKDEHAMPVAFHPRKLSTKDRDRIIENLLTSNPPVPLYTVCRLMSFSEDYVSFILLNSNPPTTQTIITMYGSSNNLRNNNYLD